MFSAFKHEENKQLWQDEPYASRKVDLRNRCSQYEINRKIDLSRFVFDDRHKVVMCVVPKVSCTMTRFIYSNNDSFTIGNSR